MMLAVFDGYFVDPAADALTSVTKLGGTPTFLAGSDSEAAQAVRTRAVCKRCKRPMLLVAQSYCPLRDGANRMMYVFCCNRSACAQFPEDSWAALAVQCDREDPAIEEPAPETEQTTDDAPEVAGSSSGGVAFPVSALAIDEEPAKEEIVQTDMEREMQRAAEAAADEPAGDADAKDLQELEEQVDLKDKATDAYYEKFRARVARAPRQALRYQLNGAPVFMNPEKTIYASIPPCPRCGGPQSMELQVMPTVLFFLRTAKVAAAAGSDNGDGTDFATVTVYACAQGCGGDRPGVVVDELAMFVEPPPTAEDEAAARGGKMSFHELVAGPSGPGPLRPPAAA